MPRVTKIFGVTLHPSADCLTCQWDWPESPHTRDNAKDHIRGNPGHEVAVQIVTRDVYRMED